MRPPEVGVVVVAPEGRDLELIPVAADGDGPEPVLVDGPGEDLEEALGPGVGGQVPVGGRAAKRGVAQGAAHDVGGLVGVPEGLEQRPDGARDRALERRQLRPRKRYVRQASLRSSPRYGVNSEYMSLRGSNGWRASRRRASSSVFPPLR